MNSSNIYLFISHAVMVFFFLSTLPVFALAVMGKISLKQEFAFTRLDHPTPGESKWLMDDPERWAKENFSEKSRNMFQDLPLKSFAAIGLLLVSVIDFDKASWPVFWVALCASSLLIVFLSHRWIRLRSRFGIATLVNARTQNWIKKEVVEQNPSRNEKGEFVVVGTPDTEAQ